MKWTIRELSEYADNILEFHEKLNLEQALKQRNTSIISVDPIQVKGYLSYSKEDILLHATINLGIVLPSTRTLEPVNCQLEISIRERYVYPHQEGNIEDYEETTLVLEQDFIELEEVVVDNILINLPVKVYNDHEVEDQFPRGDDWEVITEEALIQQRQSQRQEQGDPRLAVLKDLIKNQEDS